MKNIYKWMLNKNLLSSFLIFLSVSVFAQYEKENFLFPIKPGTINYLSANMGELRPNHFHGGYDIKTDAKIGYPVYASADGYVSKVKVSSFGYGNVIYITHPNNLVTVYAHLEKFNKPIGDFVLKNQYINQTFDVEINLGPGVIPIKRGEIIGLAGNSGSSQGPHLHYETRDTLDNVLNPSAFGFKEIKDIIPPIFQRIAIVPLDIKSRVNGEMERKEFTVAKVGNTFSLPATITGQGLLGLELKAIDKKNSTHNSYGVNYIEVYVDDKLIFVHDLSTFNHAESRYINSHMNYPLLAFNGVKFERLYVTDGNQLSTLRSNPTAKGKFIINDELPHKVRIIIKDDFNNNSSLVFTIKGKTPKEIVNKVEASGTFIRSDVMDNTLKITSKASGDPGCSLFFKDKSMLLPATYKQGEFVTYLYDLRKGLPDSARIGNKTITFDFIRTIIPGVEQKAQTSNIAVTFPPKALSDTLFLEMNITEEAGKIIYNIHDKGTPLYDSINLTINPQEPVKNKNNTFVYSKNKGRPVFEGGEWKGNKIELKTRNLGKFVILEDSIPPTIKLLSNFGNSLKFSIADNLSGIKSFNATINGYWILMNYDHKRNLLWSERLNKSVPLKGDFELTVTDEAGNANLYKVKL